MVYQMNVASYYRPCKEVNKKLKKLNGNYLDYIKDQEESIVEKILKNESV